MTENIRNNGCSQRDSAEHEGYAKAFRSFNRIWKERDSAQPKLLEAILYKDNFNRAYKRVKANKGAPGVDGMTIAQMVQHFEGITDWDRHVIIMMLKRMEAKGAVSYHTVGRAKQYYPLVDKNEACVQETEDFLDRVYKGSLGLMLTTMVQQEKISSNELDELRKILNGGEEDV